MSNMANYWTERGWDIVLITFSGGNVSDFYPLDSRVKRVRLDLRKPTSGLFDKLFFNVRRLFALRRAIRCEAPQAVISFMESTNVLTILASFFLAHRTIVSERNDPVANPATTAFWRFARRLTYRYADCVVAQTERVAHWISTECRARVTIIPNPLRDMKAPLDERENLLVAVGRLHRQKGFDLLLKAFAIVAEKYPDWSLVILGEGSQRSILESQVKALGLEHRVSMPGRVKNVEDWLERASIMVQPSRYEGFPNVVLEGMGMGLPVICTDCDSGPADIIDHQVNGILVPVNDVKSLAFAMHELMSKRTLREKLGVAALNVRDVYLPEKIMLQWERVLESQIGS